MKKIILFISVILLSNSAFSQQKTVEQIVADTACNCLSKIDINLPKDKLATQADSCMLLAIEKNITLIEKEYDPEKEEAYQEGIQFGQKLAQKVSPILAMHCQSYMDILKKLKLL